MCTTSRIQLISHSYKIKLHLSETRPGFTGKQASWLATKHSNKKQQWKPLAFAGTGIQQDQSFLPHQGVQHVATVAELTWDPRAGPAWQEVGCGSPTLNCWKKKPALIEFRVQGNRMIIEAQTQEGRVQSCWRGRWWWAEKFHGEGGDGEE